MLDTRDRIEQVQELKAKPCTQCGNQREPHNMHFVHKVATNGRNISTLTRNLAIPMDDVLEEISKCELVCAGCSTKIRAARRAARDSKYGPEITKLIRTAQRAVSARNRAVMNQLKQPLVCMDCGNKHNENDLRFVHTRGTKEWNVSGLVPIGTVTQIEEEAAKCDVLCKSCASARWQRLNQGLDN